MPSNFLEETIMPSDVLDFQEKELQKMNIPKWMNVKCPFCNKELPLRSIRSVSLKFNTRNLGDVVLEVLCDDCSKMDYLYFREGITDISSFCSLLLDNKIPLDSSPILENDMYNLKYNNVMKKMAESKGGK